MTIDGFTIQGATNSNQFGYGIVLGAGTSGAHIVNNILQNNIAGLSLANAVGGNQAVIQHNLFNNNNVAGPGSGDAIYTDQFNAGGTVSNVLIDSNTFTGQADAGLDFSSTDATKPATDITISNNDFNGNARGMLAFSLTNSSVTANTFENSTSSATADIRLFEGVNGLTITGNLLENGAGRAVRINNEGSFPALSNATNVTFALNAVEGYTGPADVVNVDPAGYTGALNASGNWWNTAIGADPSDLTAPTAINGLVSGSVTVGSFLDSGTNTATVGFTPPATTEMWVPETAATSGLTFVDGNIQEGVDSAVSGMTVRVAADTYAENLIISQSVDLKGAQAGQNANTRFAAFTGGPSDPKADPTVETVLTAPVVNPTGGNPNANDLIRVVANNITIDGLVIDGNNPALGASPVQTGTINIDARRGIQNSDANDNFFDINNLLVENNIIQNVAQRGIELSNNTTVSTGNLITGNVIRNFGSDPVNGGEGIILFTNAYADVTNNTITDVVGGAVGLQLQNFSSTGAMTWSGNDITVGQDGIGIIANLFYAPTATLNINNNTVNAASGVTSTDGLTWGVYVLSVQVGSTVNITGNTVGGSGGQFARGIDLWNLPTTNTVSVSGGTVGNSAVGIELDSSDPTFGAGAATTVNISNVAVTGGTTGVKVDAVTTTQFFPPPTTVDPTADITANLSGVTISGATTGLLVEGFNSSITATATLVASTITGATIGVDVEAEGNLGTGTQDTTENFINANTTGIKVASGAGTVQPIFDNDLSNNTTAINNGASTTIDGSGNWWGSNTRAGVQGKISGSVDYTPFLNSGTDTQPATAGFQGDFSFLNVDSQSPQAGSVGRIQEGVNDVTTGGTVNVLDGTYAENVVVNKSVTLIGANDVNPVPGRTGAETIVEPGLTSSFDTDSVFLVTASNVTIEGFTIQGSIASPPGGQSARLHTDLGHYRLRGRRHQQLH